MVPIAAYAGVCQNDYLRLQLSPPLPQEDNISEVISVITVVKSGREGWSITSTFHCDKGVDGSALGIPNISQLSTISLSRIEPIPGEKADEVDAVFERGRGETEENQREEHGFVIGMGGGDEDPGGLEELGARKDDSGGCW